MYSELEIVIIQSHDDELGAWSYVPQHAYSVSTITTTCIVNRWVRLLVQ